MLPPWVCNTLPSSLCHCHLNRRAVLREWSQSWGWCRRGHCTGVILQPLHPPHRLPALLHLPVRLMWSHLTLQQQLFYSAAITALLLLSCDLTRATQQRGCRAEHRHLPADENPDEAQFLEMQPNTWQTMCMCVTPAYTTYPPTQIPCCKNFCYGLTLESFKNN